MGLSKDFEKEGVKRDKGTAAGADERPVLDHLSPVIPPARGGDIALELQLLVLDILDTDFNELVTAQADALDYIWQALEKAEPDVTERRRVAGKGDIPFDAVRLKAMFIDIGRYLSIVQLQKPVITGQDMAGLKGKRVPVELDGHALEIEGLSLRKAVSDILAPGRDQNGRYEAKEAGFSFALFKKKHVDIFEDKALETMKMVVVPTIAIDDAILETTLGYGGLEMLQHFQEMMGLINHDYFHALTALTVKPYYGPGRLAEEKSPLGKLLGPIVQKSLDPQGEIKTASLRDSMATAFYNEFYRLAPDGAAFGKHAPYEMHALHTHKVLYNNYLDAGETGENMRTHLQQYFAGVRSISAALKQEGNEKEADRLALYYSTLMAFHLLRIVPHDHPLQQICEAEINKLGISQAVLKRSVEDRADDTRRGLKQAADMTGLDLVYEDVMDGDLKEGAMDKLSAGEIVRWHAHMIGHNVVNNIHRPAYAAPQNYALAAFREFLSVMQRDLALAKFRGGLGTLASTKIYEAHNQKKQPE